MDFRLTNEQTQWKQEVIDFLEKEATPDFLEGLERQDDWAQDAVSFSFSRKLAAKGWLGLTWPREYGGQERPLMDRAIFDEQMGYYHAPRGAHLMGCNLGGCFLRVGTEEQKARLIPPIVRQEVAYAQGFTEPQAGTDLASLITRAVRDRDCYVITGEKHYINHANYADYIFLATRTDPNVPKHGGISLFVVDLKSPGITIRPMRTVFHGRLSQLLFDNVRVPAANLIGNENEGWKIIMDVLAHERQQLYQAGSYKRIFDELVVYAREAKRDGRPVIQDPIVKFRLAEWATILEANRLISWRVAWMQSEGMAPGIATNIDSLFHREREHEFFNFAMEVLGRRGQLQLRSKDAQLLIGRVERMYRRTAASTGGGGNIELSKNIIALRGLGLPR